MKESWKQKRLDYLKKYYGPLANKWQGITGDDRAIFCNIYRMMIEALESLPEEPLNYIKVAMAHHMQQDRKTLRDIEEAFKGR